MCFILQDLVQSCLRGDGGILQQTKQKKDAGFTASVRSAPASAPGSAQKVTPFVDSD